MAKTKKEPTDQLLAELTTIKRLTVFALLKSGSSQKEIAAALGLDQSRVSRMFPNNIGKHTRDATKGE